MACYVGTRRHFLGSGLAALVALPGRRRPGIARRAATQQSTAIILVAAADASSADQAAATFICDGTDDAAVVADAIAALPPEGGTVRLSAGHFDFGQGGLTVRERSGVIIEGAGMDATLVRNRSSVAEDREVFDFTLSDRAVVRDLTVDAAGSSRLTSDALDFDDCSGCVVERVRVTASRGRGIIFDGKALAGGTVGNLIRSCDVSGCAGSGIELLCTSCCDVVDCSSHDNGDAGLKINRNLQSAQNSSHNVVLGGTYLNNGRDGISIYEGDANAVVGARCENNGRDGIRVQAFATSRLTAEDNRILGCVCRDNQDIATQDYGIRLLAEPAGTVIATRLWDNELTGNRFGNLDDGGAGTETIDRDPDRVLLSGRWRCVVVAAGRGPVADGLGLVSDDQREWLVVVTDVTNWATTEAILGPRALRVRPHGGASSQRATLQETAQIGQRLGLAAGATDDGVRFTPGTTTRVALAYSLPAGARDPLLVRERAVLPLAVALAARPDFSDLPPVDVPPSPVAPALLGPGAAARVTVMGEAMWAAPGRVGEPVARLAPGTVLAITGSEEAADNTIWWPAEAVATGLVGYVDETILLPLVASTR